MNRFIHFNVSALTKKGFHLASIGHSDKVLHPLFQTTKLQSGEKSLRFHPHVIWMENEKEEVFPVLGELKERQTWRINQLIGVSGCLLSIGINAGKDLSTSVHPNPSNAWHFMFVDGNLSMTGFLFSASFCWLSYCQLRHWNLSDNLTFRDFQECENFSFPENASKKFVIEQLKGKYFKFWVPSKLWKEVCLPVSSPPFSLDGEESIKETYVVGNAKDSPFLESWSFPLLSLK